MATIAVHLDPELLGNALHGFAEELAAAFFPQVDTDTLTPITTAAVSGVVSRWSRFSLNLDADEEARGLDALRADPDWTYLLFGHCFHDVANILRRELRATRPELDTEELRNVVWPEQMQRRWCERAVTSGVIHRLERG